MGRLFKQGLIETAALDYDCTSQISVLYAFFTLFTVSKVEISGLATLKLA